MYNEFRKNLKEARLKLNLTQIEVAEKLGVAKSTYSMYESGTREPNINTMKKIADVFNISIVVYLTFGTPTLTCNKPLIVVVSFELPCYFSLFFAIYILDKVCCLIE